jgi:hypothetical protein
MLPAMKKQRGFSKRVKKQMYQRAEQCHARTEYDDTEVLDTRIG